LEVPFVLLRSVGDCAETYKQATRYLEGAGHEIYLAKAMASQAEMYLDYSFSQVAFFELHFSDCSTLAHFTPSIIARNTRETETTKKQ